MGLRRDEVVEPVFEILATCQTWCLDALAMRAVTNRARALGGICTRISVELLRKERKARSLCIDKYGESCSFVGLKLRAVGLFAEGYIYAHHLNSR